MTCYRVASSTAFNLTYLNDCFKSTEKGNWKGWMCNRRFYSEKQKQKWAFSFTEAKLDAKVFKQTERKQWHLRGGEDNSAGNHSGKNCGQEVRTTFFKRRDVKQEVCETWRVPKWNQSSTRVTSEKMVLYRLPEIDQSEQRDMQRMNAGQREINKLH